MGRTTLIGVDLGTAGTKAAIYDAKGTLLAQAYEESILRTPRPGWVEQDPGDIYASALRTIRECLEKAGIRPASVAGIAFDGQMAGIGGVDGAWGTPIPYDSWLDTRCQPYIAAMKAHQELIIRLTGGFPTTCHGPKILWWLHERPEAFRRIRKLVVPAGYVAGRMAGLSGGEAFLDTTYLHFSCLSDAQEATWSEELCGLFGIPVEKLPWIVQPWDIVGRVTPEAARQTGLLAGTPIAAGCGDQAAGMLGAGMVEPGWIFDVAGTASVLAICTDRFVPDLEHRMLFTARLVPQGLWYALAYINGGGMNLRWFRDQFAAAEKAAGGNVYALLDSMAAPVPPGSDSLLFLPHLGGRVCPSQPELRGLWLGFTWAHTRAHFYRAILEGVAYEYALYLAIEGQLLPELEFKEARVIGGGAASPLWNQIKADVLGLPYLRLSREECATLGSAIVAGHAVGVFGGLRETARRFVRTVARVEPRPEMREVYRPFVKLYASLFDTLGETYRSLTQVGPPIC
jgi:xylulokinase